MIRVMAGDCLETLRALDADSIHACLTDPPYGLEFMGKERDKLDWRLSAGFAKGGSERFADSPKLPSFGGATSENRICRNCKGTERGQDRKGFHRCRCDAPGFPDRTYTPRDSGFAIQMWHHAWACEVYRVLKPGAYLLAFGGTRTYHRLACAIEDAGFEIRDQFAWMYGSGFPKSRDAGKAIDQELGAKRQAVETAKGKAGENLNRAYGQGAKQVTVDIPVTVPATPEAAQWQGFGTAVKPAWEPLVLARKPMIGNLAQNLLKHGTGALNIDGSRVGTEMVAIHGYRGNSFSQSYKAAGGKPELDEYRSTTGRWPANVAHDGSEEVLEAFAAFPTHGAGRARDEPYGGNFDGKSSSVAMGIGSDRRGFRFGDDSSPSRFFYTAKADKADRADSRHPTVKPVDLIRHYVRLITPPGGTVLDCFAGSGTTGEAAMLEKLDCILIERDLKSVADIEHRIKRWSGLDSPLFAG